MSIQSANTDAHIASNSLITVWTQISIKGNLNAEHSHRIAFKCIICRGEWNLLIYQFNCELLRENLKEKKNNLYQFFPWKHILLVFYVRSIAKIIEKCSHFF